jgi:hypothetical protein
VKVKLFFVGGLHDTAQKMGTWKVDFMFNTSLCDLLKITEKNFWHFTHVSGEGAGIMPFGWDLTDRPYSETKWKIDRWGRSWFEVPFGDLVNIELRMNVWDFSSLSG